MLCHEKVSSKNPPQNVMLCYATLRYSMLCYVRLRYVMLIKISTLAISLTADFVYVSCHRRLM